MIGLASTSHGRLTTGIRLLADCLDNLPDGWLPELAATVLLLVGVALHVAADLLESCPDQRRDAL